MLKANKVVVSGTILAVIPALAERSSRPKPIKRVQMPWIAANQMELEMKPSAPASSQDINITELIEQHQLGVWRYLRALGSTSELADDLTQDTFLKVLQKSFTIYDEATTAAYLRRVAHNLYISHQRRASKVNLVEDFQFFEQYWSTWVRDDNGAELLAKLKKCFEKLTPRAKWSLEMRFRDRLPRVEIAQNLKISEHGAKNLMQRAKKQLRECLEHKIDVERPE
jgi:RNA polymerase sigma-70 factor, ECF subfamily